jgi:hypothetical protein
MAEERILRGVLRECARALAAAQSKVLDLLLSDLTSSGDFGDDCVTQMRMLTTNSGQEIDHIQCLRVLLPFLH